MVDHAIEVQVQDHIRAAGCGCRYIGCVVARSHSLCATPKSICHPESLQQVAHEFQATRLFQDIQGLPTAHCQDGPHEPVAQPRTRIKALRVSRLIGHALDERGGDHDVVLWMHVGVVLASRGGHLQKLAQPRSQLLSSNCSESLPAVDQKQKSAKRPIEPGTIIHSQPGLVSSLMGPQPRTAFRLPLVAHQRIGHIRQLREAERGPRNPGSHVRRKPLPKVLQGVLQTPGARDHQLVLGDLAYRSLQRWQAAKVLRLMAMLWMQNSVEIQEEYGHIGETGQLDG